MQEREMESVFRPNVLVAKEVNFWRSNDATRRGCSRIGCTSLRAHILYLPVVMGGIIFACDVPVRMLTFDMTRWLGRRLYRP
jgi:hypothetical protein